MDKALPDFYRNHVEEVLLPFWDRAVDEIRGGIYTCFNNTGDERVSNDKYSWSQGRFLWLWSVVARMIDEGKLDGKRERYLSHLHKSASFLEKYIFLENGNCAFLLAEDGTKKEPVPGEGYDTSIYADCFVALGLAKFATLTKDNKRFQQALDLYDQIRARIKMGTIRTEPYPIPEGYRAHAIPMIMLNLSQELAEGAEKLNHQHKRRLLQQSTSYMRTIMEDFYQADHRVIEMLPENKDSAKHRLLFRHINPGHTIESMWFVIHTAQKTGNRNYLVKAITAIDHALDVGWDPKYGGLLRFTDAEGGKPAGERTGTPYEQLVVDSWDMKLWWPHAEALYATLLAYKITGDPRMYQRYTKMARYVFSTFPNPDTEIGEWIQIRDRKGDPVDKVAALPVKDPFHILRSMLLIIDLLDGGTVKADKQD
ncbi:AGE family epimerase/isomerase [Halalkalibaculum sp. DA384]|uniref:AGE family epimerase/isomerase n=1 Tax=Halalkalibaculum sp. DA384 TaxID=3373606 RepID=UPI003754DEB2